MFLAGKGGGYNGGKGGGKGYQDATTKSLQRTVAVITTKFDKFNIPDDDN
jgi:hypothetical protein